MVWRTTHFQRHTETDRQTTSSTDKHTTMSLWQRAEMSPRQSQWHLGPYAASLDGLFPGPSPASRPKDCVAHTNLYPPSRKPVMDWLMPSVCPISKPNKRRLKKLKLTLPVSRVIHRAVLRSKRWRSPPHYTTVHLCIPSHPHATSCSWYHHDDDDDIAVQNHIFTRNKQPELTNKLCAKINWCEPHTTDIS